MNTFFSNFEFHLYSGNFDIAKMHYDGPGNVPGSSGEAYSYAERTKGRSSDDTEAVA